MTNHKFLPLEPDALEDTRNAIHAYSRILGSWAKSSRARRKHWWHASLRPNLTGFTTGVVYGDIDFEISLNLRESALTVQTATGEQIWEELHGQPAHELASRVRRFLESQGVSNGLPELNAADAASAGSFDRYSTEQANKLGRVVSAVTAALERFRAGVREESSPIQLWPHHFDLAMLWLPGNKIAGQDPNDEEYADKQMNFGFTFGDDAISEPYFYVTAYPLPDEFPSHELPAGTVWQTQGFAGAITRYNDLHRETDPGDYLQQLWNGLLADGRQYLATQSS